MNLDIDAREMYRVFTSSGLGSVLGSFGRLYIISLLYNETEGLTCSMIYCSYKKDLLGHEVLGELSISRSHIADHLNDFETEGLVEKGAFKQYILTEKGRIIFEFTRKLIIDVSAFLKSKGR